MVIDVADENFNTDIMNMVKEKFGEEYNLIIKNWSGDPDTQQTLKTAALAGEPGYVFSKFDESADQCGSGIAAG